MNGTKSAFERLLDQMSTTKLVEFYKDYWNDNAPILKILRGRHEITQEQFNDAVNCFWGAGEPYKKMYYGKIELEKIFKLYDDSINQNWIRFAPSNSPTVADIRYEPVTTFDRTASCYPIVLFLGIYNIMKDPTPNPNDVDDILEVTKGCGEDGQGTVVLFRLLRENKETICYDISTDPGAYNPGP